MVDWDEFMNEPTTEDAERLLTLNPIGDKYSLVHALKYHTTRIVNDQNVTVDFLYSKYEEYLTWWQRKFGTQEEKYIAKANKLKTVLEFVESSMYEQSFKEAVKLDPRSLYIFGNIETITKAYDKFYKT